MLPLRQRTREISKMEQNNDFILQVIKTNIAALLPYFEDEITEDIMVNPDGSVWLNQKGRGEWRTDIVLRPNQREDFLKIVASMVRKPLDKERSKLTAVIPRWGYRIEGHIPPSVKGAAFAIRIGAKFTMTLDDYVQNGIMSTHYCERIRQAIRARKNILIAGGTGSGKTTLTNAILAEFADSSERFVILEDTEELQCPAPNKYSLCATETVSLKDLVESSLRLFPRRIVIGEIRSGIIAYDFLNAAISGHPGAITTMHADSPRDALTRLQLMLQQVFSKPQPEFIARAVDLIVFIERVGAGRKVSSMAMCKAHTYDANGNGNYVLEEF